jgi:hypothetical protein
VNEVVQSYNFKLLTGGPFSDGLAMDDLVELMEALWIITKQLHSVAVTFRRLRGQYTRKGRLLPEQTFDPLLVGTVIDNLITPQVTAPLSFKTTTPNVMLRKLFGPMGENNLTGESLLQAGTQTIMGLAGVFLLETYAATNGAWQYGYHRPVPFDWVVPDSAQFTAVPGTLRRRRAGQGS